MCTCVCVCVCDTKYLSFKIKCHAIVLSCFMFIRILEFHDSGIYIHNYVR